MSKTWPRIDRNDSQFCASTGRHIVVGSGVAVALAVVVDITDDGIVHVHPLSGSAALGSRPSCSG